MNALEEIQAAIDKLNAQIEQSTSGPWWAWHPASERGNSSVDAPSGDPDNPKMPVEGERADVDLIVTLHRSIDAQLAILGDATHFTTVRKGEVQLRDDIGEYALDLARAINGTA